MKLLIHQIWFQGEKNLPNRYKPWKDRWVSLADEYKLWDAVEIEELIKEHLHPSYLTLYLDYQHDIQRIDFAKYVILYLRGGVYCDMDMQLVQDDNGKKCEKKRCKEDPQKHVRCMRTHFKSTLCKKQVSIAEYSRHSQMIPFHISVENFFLHAARPRHPFYRYVLQKSHNAAKRSMFDLKVLFVLKSTGPAFLTDCLTTYPHSKRQIEVLEKDKFETVFRHFSDKVWIKSISNWSDTSDCILLACVVLTLLTLRLIYLIVCFCMIKR